MKGEIKLDEDKKKALDEICGKLRELGLIAQIKTEQVFGRRLQDNADEGKDCLT